MNTPPDAVQFPLGMPVRVRKTGETGHVTGAFNDHTRDYYEVETDRGVLWPLVSTELEALCH
jgi:hypothetical protein